MKAFGKARHEMSRRPGDDENQVCEVNRMDLAGDPVSKSSCPQTGTNVTLTTAAAGWDGDPRPAEGARGWPRRQKNTRSPWPTGVTCSKNWSEDYGFFRPERTVFSATITIPPCTPQATVVGTGRPIRSAKAIPMPARRFTTSASAICVKPPLVARKIIQNYYGSEPLYTYYYGQIMRGQGGPDQRPETL